MNEALQLEIVDLGEAKEVTMGADEEPNSEDHPVLIRRLEG